jgi:hypothetical protein
MSTDLPQKLREELEMFGRLCTLSTIQLANGVPAPIMRDHLERTKRVIERVETLLADNMGAWIQVNPAIASGHADLLAEKYLGDPQVPDTPEGLL